MAHERVDAGGDQLVILADVETHRPVASEILVRAVKQPHGNRQYETSKPGERGHEGAIGEAQKVESAALETAHDIGERNDAEAGERNRHEGFFAQTPATFFDGRLARAAAGGNADDEPGHRADEKDDHRERRRHFLPATAAALAGASPA